MTARLTRLHKYYGLQDRRKGFANRRKDRGFGRLARRAEKRETARLLGE
jgi:hypothetical protein